jgi:hypothetical protein
MNFRAARRQHHDEALRLANEHPGKRRGMTREAHRVRVIEKAMQLRREIRGRRK